MAIVTFTFFLNFKGFPPTRLAQIGSEFYSKVAFGADLINATSDCSKELLGTQRLIMSLEDDFNPSWIIFRLFDLVPFSPGEFSISNYGHLKKLHDSLPCGLGGVHLSASILFSERDFEKLRWQILKDFSVTANLHNESVLIRPLITYDLPRFGGINHDIVLRKFGTCCNEFQNSIRANFVFGPNLDDHHDFGAIEKNKIYRDLSDKTYAPILVSKHFGLEDLDKHHVGGSKNSHWGRVIVKRSDKSLIDEWEKLANIPTKSVLKGIMVSHAYIAGDVPFVPLTSSNRITGYQAGNKNIFSVSDSLDMTLNYEGLDDDVPITTDFVLWVNFYSSAEYADRFLNMDHGSRVDKVLDVKVREKLYEIY